MAELVQAHDQFLRRMGMLMCGNWALSEDLVQETWLRAWRSLHNLREPQAARAWLMTILRREFARHLSRSCADEKPLDSLGDEPACAANLEQEVLVDQLSTTLDPEQQCLFELCLRQGHSYQVAAQKMCVNPSTLGVRLYRLRQQLRELVDQSCVAA